MGKTGIESKRYHEICNAKQVLPSRLLYGLIATPTEALILQELEACLKLVKPSERQRIGKLLDIGIGCILNTEPKLCRAGLGERIRILRVDAGLKICSLANACMISMSTLRGYESGQYDPSIQVLLNLCRIFQVSPDYLLYPCIEWKFPGDNRLFLMLPRQLRALLQSIQYLHENFVLL